ncbi:hypothetical protein [Mycobacterium avium]|uniref:hypothetical protein n=1 Tax=Mycobacterium avium TaxID=1764 RepID=UPI0004A0644E|nr:hypothetical protein [Mycobacterium avium]KDP02927.1 hypothetical protein MAV3388_01845 [Mycobacterium avium subsp. hominissuis 3388]MBZ4535334.1 hypothetical protein [Mycobacterium avium subsp. hominissuis]MBZ4576857.1 hypothetical protein [Mycobacterium avium subsp. hominissuis]MBZ4592152.1 hypothetical protein [Mycobacterium avium subsp. hominissuis]MBZ4604772.1 hypothetical protein [Mycobacterium avium subsp. hominissuis]
MRLVADSGLWTTGRADVTEEPPLVALLEVSGAVLSWTLDDPDDAPPRLTFTDVSRADWLWRVLGEAGHVALVSAVRDAAVPAGGIELAGVDVAPGALAPLRRLATGHWLRRWWPASRQDGIAGLDRALLDAELALLTAGAQHFFPDDTLDSDVAGLLAPHATALLGHLVSPDPRVADLVRASAGLADGIGVDAGRWPELLAALDDSSLVMAPPSDRRDDYALAAGAGAGPRAAAIARGVASVAWSGVPPGVFDAAEDTVGWSIRVDGSAVVAVVQADVIGPDPATGIAVRLRSAAVEGAGALDAAGRATFPLTGARGALTESAAWGHDWSATEVQVGAAVSTESPHTRERVRRWARARLESPPRDAFLAEILAAESAY